MEESFNIQYADTTLNIRPIWEKDTIVAYQIFVGELYLAEIYPDHGVDNGEPPLVWRSHDILVTDMINAIGQAIEDHDA